MITLTAISNSYRNAGFDHGDAEVSSRAESSSPQVATIPESERGVFRNKWNKLNDMIGELPTLEDYVDIDIHADCAKRLPDKEIMVAFNDQVNLKLDENKKTVC